VAKQVGMSHRVTRDTTAWSVDNLRISEIVSQRLIECRKDTGPTYNSQRQYMAVVRPAYSAGAQAALLLPKPVRVG
jgi:hypothetical protein